ncbi:RNA-directed DNA polymerase, eukaryota, reverse transcriptase zinc-binding domain protein [Tanacetum coccineum]
MPPGSNSSFITLIPKVSNPIHITDFRPISLIGIHYKIIAKVLVNRLSRLINKIVSPEQTTFIVNRQILDGPLILSEVIDWYKKRKKKMLLFKVDFEKAFDSVRWRYLDFMLCNLGFGLTWRSWIKACFESSRTSILVNGSPTSEFNVSRSLRQGDPLSPFLFVIIMEGLHVAISDSVRNGLIRGIQVGSSDVFFLAPGPKINIRKSNIYDVGVSPEDVHLMASVTGCSARSFPFTYLGLPIGSNMSLTANWKPLVDKFHSKLSSWKANMLSYGGRLTLLKSVLGSLGGLDIGSLKSFKLALLHKWRWSFHTNRDSLWVKVIYAFHGSEGGFDQNGCKFNGIWSRIVGTSNYLHSSSILPMESIRFQWNWSRNDLGTRNSTYLNHLLAEISHIEVREGMDKCIWYIAHDGTFTVSSLRRIIDVHTFPSLDTKTYWDKSLPRKVNIFMWRLKLDRLSRRLNLSSRGIEIPEISCPSCNGNMESNHHIFFECSLAKEVWKIIRRWCNDSFPLFDSNDHWTDWLSSWAAPRAKKNYLYVIITASLWFI